MSMTSKTWPGEDGSGQTIAESSFKNYKGKHTHVSNCCRAGTALPLPVAAARAILILIAEAAWQDATVAICAAAVAVASAGHGAPGLATLARPGRLGTAPNRRSP